MKSKILFIVFGLVLWMGCHDEEVLSPTEKPEFKYALPQGQHDYDSLIVDWYDRCGFYILYKFEPKDLYFNVNEWRESVYDSTFAYQTSGINAVLADENYVGEQLKLVEDKFLHFYPDALLKRCMPMKLLLCGELYSSATNVINMSVGFDNIAINWGCKEIENLSEEQKRTFKSELNIAFIRSLTSKGKFSMSKVFLEQSIYGVVVNRTQMYAKGFIQDSYYETSESTDWFAYVEAIIRNPYTYLSAEPESEDYTLKGILHPKKDVNHLIRNKYKIMVDYFQQEYGIDIQAMGDDGI